MSGLPRRAARRLFALLPARARQALHARRSYARAGIWRVAAHRRRLAAEVTRVLGARDAPGVLLLPTHSWHQASFQRPQQLARAFGEIGCTVLYPERLGTHAWSMVDEEGRNRRRGLEEVSRNVHAFRLAEADLPGLLARARPSVVLGSAALEQGPWLPAGGTCALVYDVFDHERIKNPTGDPAWRAAHEAWIRDARLVLASAPDIADPIRRARPDVLLVPNGVRTEDWTEGPPPPVPEDLRPARRAPVVVYYHGILGDPWFDFPLWRACCERRPAWAFVLVGWPHGRTRESLEAEVASIPNGHWLGPKPYPDLPAYLRHADVAAVPFLVNEATHAANAIKVFEYFAAGKPVVSTPLRALSPYRSIRFAASPQEFVEAAEEGLARRDDPEERATREREARENSWRERAETVRRALARPREAAGAPARRP